MSDETDMPTANNIDISNQKKTSMQIQIIVLFIK